MNPSAINTLFSTSANPGSTNKVSQSTSTPPFNDVFMRELNDRKNSASESQASASEVTIPPTPQQAQKNNAAQSPVPSQQAEKPQNQAQNLSKSGSDGSNAGASAKQSSDTKSAAATKGEKAKKTADDGDKDGTNMEGTGVTSASAELMALVNSLVQKPGVDTSASVDTETTEARAVSGKGGQALLKEVGDDKADDRPTAALLAKIKELGPKQAAVSETTTDDASEGPSKDVTTTVDPTALPGKKTAHGTALLASPNDVKDMSIGRGKDVAPGRIDIAAADLRKLVEPAALIRQTETQTDTQIKTTLIGTVATSGVNTRQAAGMPTDTLTPRVGTTAWDNALGQKVVWMAAGAQQSATITLNPPDLGPLQVVINVTNAQADATFTSAQPEVRQALEAALPRLKEMLGDAGISLGQASVNAGSPNQHGAANQDQSQAGTRSRQLNLPTSQNVNDITSIAPGRNRAMSGGDGMVDTFA